MSTRIIRRMAILAVALLIAVGPGCLELLDRVPNARAGPGDNAKDYLSDSKFKKLVVEIDSAPGSDPNPEALQKFKDALNAHLRKPDGITYDTSGLGSVQGKGKGAKYTLQELADLEKAHREHYSKGDTAVLYVLYVDGGYTKDSDDNRVLGLVYHGTGLVMFKGNIKDVTTSGGLLTTRPEERCVERAVLVHELGHVLGLVGNGIDMTKPRMDPASKGHTTNKASVMYHAIEGSKGLLDLFTGGCSSIPHEFDADDKADLRAAGGK